MPDSQVERKRRIPGGWPTRSNFDSYRSVVPTREKRGEWGSLFRGGAGSSSSDVWASPQRPRERGPWFPLAEKRGEWGSLFRGAAGS